MNSGREGEEVSFILCTYTNGGELDVEISIKEEIKGYASELRVSPLNRS